MYIQFKFYSDVVGNNVLNNVFTIMPTVGSNTFSNNFNNVDLDTVFEIVPPVNQFGYDVNYTLLASAQSAFLGTDGTQVGIYGGTFPFKLNSVPTNPSITSKDIAQQTNDNGELAVDVTLKLRITNLKDFIMRQQLLYIILFAPWFFYGQIDRYEYWFDDNYQNKIAQTITQTDNFDLNTLIDSDGVEAGVHSYSIHFKDADNNWSSVLTQFFYKVPDSYLVSNPKINAYEYWFDADYNNKVSQGTSSEEIFVLDGLFDTNSLEDGVHSFSIRFKDENNEWSSVLTQFFYKVPDSYLVENPKINAYEYWFDADYDNKVTQSTSSEEIFVLDGLFDTNNLEDGVHSFSIRFKDENGEWSSVLTQFIYKIPDSYMVENPNIETYEYWFNGDYDNKISTDVTPEQIFTLDEMFDADFLVNGIHTFSIRFKDENSEWSGVLTQFIYKTDESTTTLKEITAYQYWFNDDFDSETTVDVTPNTVFNLDTFVMPESFGLDLGMHDLNIRFKDSAGLWSSVITEEFELTVLLDATFPEIQSFDVTVYPNPTTGQLNVELPKYHENVKVIFADLSGRILSQKDYQNTEEINFNVEFPPGVYLMIYRKPI